MTAIEEQNVFLVDIKSGARRDLTETLEHFGLSVTCFGCGSDCLEHLSSQRCDLIVAELKMSGMDGLELLKRVRTLAPWIPFLIITGNGDIPAAVKAIKSGADDFIEKPLEKISFEQTVKSLLSVNGNHLQTGKPLTLSEKKVLRLILGGNNNREIARLLSRSVRTVEVHRSHIMKKLGADNLVDLLKRAMAMGLTEPVDG